jgi:hypothetical protein
MGAIPHQIFILTRYYDEVVKILGEADACDGALGIKNCTWGNDKKHINVNFAGNKVLMYSAKGL